MLSGFLLAVNCRHSIYTSLHATLASCLRQAGVPFLNDPALLAVARLSGFVQRRLRKLDLHGLVLSCLLLALQRSASLRKQAILAGMCSGTTISKQGLHKRLSAKIAPFLQACLAAAVAHRLASQRVGLASGHFARVLVQDSTCLALSPALAQHFPGAANQTGKAHAGLRVQCLYDLITERFVWFFVSAFTRNDQAAAADVLALLRPGDLLMRDLGYFSLASLQKLAQAGAFFLTRLRYGLSLFDPDTGEPLQLARLLRPGVTLDRPVRVGQGKKLLARLIALPLPEGVVNERRRKARANRDKRLRHSADYLHLLGWAIFITNAPAQRLPISIVPKLYRLRWRIEIVFKAWKSHWGLTGIETIGPRQVEPLLYGALLLIVLTHCQPLLPDAQTALPAPSCVHPTAPPALSLLRLTELCADWLPVVLFASVPPEELTQRLLAQFNAHARYERRRRNNYLDLRAEVLG